MNSANSLADVPSPTIKITEASLELINSPLNTQSQHYHNIHFNQSQLASGGTRNTSSRKNSESTNKLQSSTSIEEKRRLSACSSGSGFNSSQHKSSSSASSMSFRTLSQPSTPTTPPLISNKEHMAFNDSRTSGDSDLCKRVDNSVESDV
jgi:hypothetical protein